MKNWLILHYWVRKKITEKSLTGRRLSREVIFLSVDQIVSSIFLFIAVT